MNTVHYFAYGSNMSSERFRQRVPSGERHSVAVLHNHALAFHKLGVDGSAKCDVVDTGHPGSRVYGVVYTFDEEHLPQLDLAEGNGYGYQRREVEVDVGSGTLIQAECYFATHVIAGLMPYGWYREHVLAGARQACLPPWYIDDIAAIPCQADPDQCRHARELSVYAPAVLVTLASQ